VQKPPCHASLIFILGPFCNPSFNACSRFILRIQRVNDLLLFSSTFNVRLTLIALARFDSFGLPPTYHDKDFFEAFQQSFMSVARSMNPNDHDSTIITPEWPTWSGNREEMLFNKTDDDLPIVKVIQTPEHQATLCRYYGFAFHQYIPHLPCLLKLASGKALRRLMPSREEASESVPPIVIFLMDDRCI